MNLAIAFFIFILLLVVGILLRPQWVQWQRDRLKQKAFPPLWLALVEETLPFYSKLSPEQRRDLQGYIQVFLAEKQFIGCGGLQVTEEMRVRIAAIACLLLFNKRESYFWNLRSILIYPTAYFATETRVEHGITEEQRIVRLGESWSRDQLVLSWQQVQHDYRNWGDGHNVVLHEFAHQLDQETGTAEGVPILQQKVDYQRWRSVMTAAYEGLCYAIQRGQRTVFDPYGATNPIEFFAVATETFFERSRSLQQAHPDLYALLHRYYQLDPIAWQ